MWACACCSRAAWAGHAGSGQKTAGCQAIICSSATPYWQAAGGQHPSSSSSSSSSSAPLLLHAYSSLAPLHWRASGLPARCHASAPRAAGWGHGCAASSALGSGQQPAGLWRPASSQQGSGAWPAALLTSGRICLKCLSRQAALGVPTSSRVATAWRLREETVTWSKSINRSLPTPERSSRCAAWLPTPCMQVAAIQPLS